MLQGSAAITVAVSLAAALTMTVGSTASAADDAKYPNWKGQWLRQEYLKVLQDSIADQANGGLGNDPTAQCFAAGMPRMMTYEAQEYVITPEVTYILLGGDDHLRRVHTDGRNWPANINPTYQGYSIGRWIDEDGDGTYDVLEVETRGPFRGPRAYDASGLPLHLDNESAFKEKFYIDKADPNLLHDVITVIDRALTQPWTVDKTFRRSTEAQPDWPEHYCHVTNNRVVLGGETYRLDDERILMPTRKDQPPPDLQYFSRSTR